MPWKEIIFLKTDTLSVSFQLSSITTVWNLEFILSQHSYLFHQRLIQHKENTVNPRFTDLIRSGRTFVS